MRLFNNQTKTAVISPRKAREMMAGSGDYMLLDVRTQPEYDQIRIAGAKLIPVDELSLHASAELPDKHIPILVYCHSGTRAGIAVKLLAEMGYTNVLSFGGIIDWKYDTVRG